MKFLPEINISIKSNYSYLEESGSMFNEYISTVELQFSCRLKLPVLMKASNSSMLCPVATLKTFITETCSSVRSYVRFMTK